jgi:hypothetical protein
MPGLPVLAAGLVAVLVGVFNWLGRPGAVSSAPPTAKPAPSSHAEKHSEGHL